LSGGLTGRGADLIIIDDPIKADDVASDLKRASTNASFYNTVYSRLNNKEAGAIVVIMQRLHVDDFVAYVTERERWDIVSLPVIADADECYRIATPYGVQDIVRHQGEALHPARESVAMLQELRRKVGDYVFAAQYQQNPLPREGGIIKKEWLLYYREAPESFDRIVQSWDTASKEAEGNSYNVCTTWGVLGKKFYLLHRYRERVEFDRLKTDALHLAHRFRPSTIIIEAQATGNALLSELKRSTNFNVQAAPATAEGKIARLEAKIDRFAGGLVHLPCEAEWLADYEAELTQFPATRYSDQVDSTVQALGTVAPGDEGSFDRYMEFTRLQGAQLDNEHVRLKIPPDAGMITDIEGRLVRPDADGVAIVDWRTAGALMHRNPRIQRLDS